MSQSEWIQVPLADAVVEAQVRGRGEPVVLIQTAVTADEFLPLAVQREFADAYQVIVYHRRGYGGSSPVDGRGSVERDARDCEQLLDALGVEKAHIFGGSYSGAVALHLAASAPNRVHTLCLAEPPPVHTPTADEFRSANAQLTAYYRQHGSAAAMDYFMTRLMGSGWRTELEAMLPGGTAQVERDADTFFATDIPSLLAWRFGAEDAARITQPVLYVGGTESGPWFAEVGELLLRWLPQAEEAMLSGADHSLALTHAPQLARALTGFLGKHPMERH
ncbi:alpha/beta fold hydrolase [Arthrobacter sp. L77]|uniref:alpha/beta fold hydrolase n=1 Tax=Arthrobacter sp. L77 TaxID=1496689 RepID=UPI000691C498|nr:alpha/beta hydrolase [Arthrobacter sp. L77]